MYDTILSSSCCLSDATDPLGASCLQSWPIRSRQEAQRSPNYCFHCPLRSKRSHCSKSCRRFGLLQCVCPSLLLYRLFVTHRDVRQFFRTLHSIAEFLTHRTDHWTLSNIFAPMLSEEICELEDRLDKEINTFLVMLLLMKAAEC